MRGIFLICLWAAMPVAVQAATVKKIKAQKRIVILSEGKSTGFLKKKKVCIYDSKKTKLACGLVRSAKSKISSVLIKSEEEFAKIAVGMKAVIETIDNKAVTITIDEHAPIVSELGYTAPNYIGLFGGFPILDPVSYQNLVYETPLALPSDSMWSQDSPVKSVSIGAEVGFGFRAFTLALGVRQRTYSPKRVSADYADRDSNFNFEEFVDSIGTGSALGFWMDFYYARWDWGVASLDLGNGIDMDNSKVAFTLDHLSDLNNTVDRYYDVTSQLQAISLRTNLLLNFKFGPVGFKMGSIIFVPLQQEQKLSVTQVDPFTVEFLKGKSAEEDVKEKLAHKSQMGLELLLMGYFAY